MMSKANFNIKARTLFENQIGLVLYMALDEGEGNVAHDFSGKGNNGTIYGATWVNGKYGKALSFDGVNDYVGIPHSTPLVLTSTFTLMLWLKTSKTGSYQYLIAKRPGGTGTRGYCLFISDANEACGVIDDGTGAKLTSSGLVVTDGKFHFLAYTRDGDVQKIYVDGILKATTNYAVGDISNTEPVRIGARGDLILFFDGITDEVRIYNRALTSSEILDLFLNSPKRSYLPSKLKVRGVS